MKKAAVFIVIWWPGTMSQEEKEQASVEQIAKIRGKTIALDENRRILLGYSDSFDSLYDVITQIYNLRSVVFASVPTEGKPFVV